jgi:hemolysin-activating ACP:hemolysin acyltransferase
MTQINTFLSERGNRMSDATILPSSVHAELSSDELRRRAELSKRMMAAFGEAVSVLMRSETHRHLFLADLETLLLPPIAAGQFSLMDAQSKAVGFTQPVGLALWARVSAEVDRRLSSNLDLPMRLKPDEWTSGDIFWIVEAVGDQRAMGPLLKALSEREWKGKPVKLRARDEAGRPVVKVIEGAKG